MDPNTIASIAGILGISAKETLSALRRHTEREHESVLAERVVAFAQGGLRCAREGLVTDLINRLYSREDLSAAGFERPIINTPCGLRPVTVATRREWATRPVELGGGNEISKLITGLAAIPTIDEEMAGRLLVEFTRRNLRIWDAPLYRLVGIDFQGGKLLTDFAIESFLRYRMSNGALLDEVVQAFVDTDFSPDRILSNHPSFLPLRHKLIHKPSDIADFKSRLCTGGVNVTTAIARPPPEDDYAIILQRRSASVSTRQGALSILPAGHHQPMIQPRAEVAISNTVFRELYEELFGGDECTKSSKHLIPGWYFENCPSLNWFKKHGGAFDLLLTGFGISLISGSFTFSVLLAIHDTSFWTDFSSQLCTNWESSDDQEPIFSSRSDSVELVLRPEWTDYGIL